MSFDALALVVRESLALDPESGALFVFASKRSNRIKVLWFDTTASPIIRWPRKARSSPAKSSACRLLFPHLEPHYG